VVIATQTTLEAAGKVMGTSHEALNQVACTLYSNIFRHGIPNPQHTTMTGKCLPAANVAKRNIFVQRPSKSCFEFPKEA
jgi:hypothetical protein